MRKHYSSTLLGLMLLLTTSVQAKTLDLMVLYTPEATQTWEGRDINARIHSFVEYFNRTLENSDTDLQVRLVHTQLMNWRGNLNRATNYNLNTLSYDQRVNEIRNRVGADVVSLVYRNPPGESCGIGWIATGKNGRFYNYSASGGHGYNLSAVNCYIHIVAHETGHNMGLRHSPAQDPQEGYNYYYNHTGSFAWSRGYGVNGVFVTPMAYPNYYGTWNVQPVFSNPRKTCNGFACGEVSYADASWAVKTMADQITRFRPTQIGDDDPSSNDTLFDFEQNYDGWSAFYSELGLLRDVNSNNNLWITDRNTYYSGAVGDLTDVIEGNQRYEISGRVWVNNNASDNYLLVYLYVQAQDGNYQFLRVSHKSINGSSWKSFQNDIQIPYGNVKRALLYVYGPQAGSNFLLDDVKIQQ